MKTSYAFLLPLILVLFSCCGKEERCKEEEPSKHTVYYLSDENKLKIPFRSDGLDTLVYISDAGDTATLYGKGKETYWYNKSVNRNIDPGCPFYDYHSTENIVYNFEGTNPLLRIIPFRFCVVPDNILYPHLINSQKLYVSFNSNIALEQLDKIYPDGDNLGVRNLSFINTENNYTNPITIGNTNYSCCDLDSGILFNYHYGILRFHLNNKTWTKKM